MKRTLAPFNSARQPPDVFQSIDHSVSLQDVDVYYGDVPVLHKVSVNVKPGERIAFIGPSGAGKTTILRLIAGMLSPHGGSATVFSQNLAQTTASKRRQVAQRIGFVFQDFALTPSLSVLQNVACGRLGQSGWRHGIRSVYFPRRSEAEAIYLCLEQLGIGDTLYRRTSTLSGGQMQRVAIARALYQSPDLLIADEPVSNVDPGRADRLIEQLTNLTAQLDLTLCVSLHDLNLAKRYFDRLIGLRGGRIAFDAAPEHIPHNAIQALYELELDGPNEG